MCVCMHTCVGVHRAQRVSSGVRGWFSSTMWGLRKPSHLAETTHIIFNSWIIYPVLLCFCLLKCLPLTWNFYTIMLHKKKMCLYVWLSSMFAWDFYPQDFPPLSTDLNLTFSSNSLSRDLVFQSPPLIFWSFSSGSIKDLLWRIFHCTWNGQRSQSNLPSCFSRLLQILLFFPKSFSCFNYT